MTYDIRRFLYFSGLALFSASLKVCARNLSDSGDLNPENVCAGMPILGLPELLMPPIVLPMPSVESASVLEPECRLPYEEKFLGIINLRPRTPRQTSKFVRPSPPLPFRRCTSQSSGTMIWIGTSYSLKKEMGSLNRLVIPSEIESILPFSSVKMYSNSRFVFFIIPIYCISCFNDGTGFTTRFTQNIIPDRYIANVSTDRFDTRS